MNARSVSRRLAIAAAMAFAASVSLPSAATAATPQDIPGLALWLDASDVYGNGTNPADGDMMSQWIDKAQNITFNVHGDTWRRPTYDADAKDGLPAVHFQRPDANHA